MGHIDKITTFCKEQYRKHSTNAVIYCLSTTLSQVKLKKVLVALGFAFGSLTLIAPTPSKAEDGCPNGFFPIGGGYCRNIVCTENSADWDPNTEPVMKKYGLSCYKGRKPQGQNERGLWGSQTIPMR